MRILRPDYHVVFSIVRLAGDTGVRTDGPRVLVDLPPDRAPELVRALVADGVEVHEVASAERTLEEVFFEMTRHDPSEQPEATR